MKKLSLLAFGLTALAGGLLHAQTTASTEPVGYNSITCLGNSDTRFSVPFHRATAYQGTVQSVAGNVVTVQGTPGWTANQYVYAAGTQTNTYYLEFGSGAKVGMSYTVTANDTTSVTLNLNGDTISSVVSGDTVRIIPYWTLSTLFPGQSGITTTTSITGIGALTLILVPDVSTAGIDLAAASTYFYYSGSSFGGPGWRKKGGGSTIRDNDIVPPDVFTIVRQSGVGTSTVMTGTGSVPVTTSGATVRKYVVGTVQSNTPQDNAIALDIPVALSLTQSNLFQSGAFVGTTSITGLTGDLLLIYDDTSVAQDKAASSTYFYYTGSSFGGPGWRKKGGGTTIRDSEVVFQPGSGVVIRKQATANPSTSVWAINLSY